MEDKTERAKYDAREERQMIMIVHICKGVSRTGKKSDCVICNPENKVMPPHNLYDTIKSKDATIAELKMFVRKFQDNFINCENCNGYGSVSADESDCRICHGTGKTIYSIGVLYVELPVEAQALLEKTSQ